MVSEELKVVSEMMRVLAQHADEPLEEIRAQFEAMSAGFTPSADIRTERLSAGGVPAEWVVAPGAGADRTMLYLHGGGYVVGSINTHRDLAARLSRAARARVLVIDYRLAPEHPYPAAVEDAMATYRWLLAAGVPPQRIVIAGDSAGGGLTVATLVALRDAREPLPAAGVCLSPWVDLEGSGESMKTKAAVDPLVSRERVRKTAAYYLAGQDPRTPLAAPLYADLTGLPALLIQVGTAETLLDDSTRLAARARQAGVTVTLEPCEDMVHVWQVFAAILPEGQRAIERIGEFILQHLP